MCRTTQVFGQRRITIAELLSRVLEAHGGLNNWSKVTKVTAQLSFGRSLLGRARLAGCLRGTDRYSRSAPGAHHLHSLYRHWPYLGPGCRARKRAGGDAVG
jgi:hypothetical protein